MKSKLFFVVALVTVLFISTPAPAQGEEVTLSTYYPAPFGEYDELCAEKLLVDLPSAAELQDMARGDCHITRSLIVGQGGAPGGFSYDEIGGSLADGTVLIKGDVGIGTPEPDGVLHIERDGAAGTTLLHLTGNSEEYAGLRFRIGGGNAAGAQDYFEITGRPSYAAGVGSGGDIRILRWHNPYPTNTGNLWLMPDGGNVGIGTTSPTHKLSVVGTNLDTVAIGQIGGNARQLLIGYDTANNRGEIQALEQNVGWRNLTLNRYGGNVGIGTTSPTAKLHIGGTAGTDGIRFPDGTLQTTAAGGIGTVANVVMVQTRAQATYSAPPSGYGTIITPLNLVITPKKAGNRIILEWIVSGEMFHDTVYIVTRNDALLADTTNAANNRWAGVTAQPYDANTHSTPDNAVVKIIDMNSLDVATTYQLRVRSSSGGTYTLYLNRTLASAGQDAYEASLSVGTATEIWQ